MKAYTIKCPECGATIDVDSEREKIFCTYCGTQIILDDEIDRKEVTHRYIDEAEIVKSNNEVQMKKMQYEERKRHEANLKNFIIISCILFAILCVIIALNGW